MCPFGVSVRGVAGLMGLSGVSNVVRYEFQVLLSVPSFYGDFSQFVLRVYEKLTAKGYNANVRYRVAASGGHELVGVLSRGPASARVPFSSEVAAADVRSAATGSGAQLGAIKQFVTEVATFAKEAPATSASGVQQFGKSVADKGLLDTLGVPKWVLPVALAGVGLYALSQVAAVARLFKGAT